MYLHSRWGLERSKGQCVIGGPVQIVLWVARFSCCPIDDGGD